MKKEKVYFFPPHPRFEEYGNPYSQNYRDALKKRYEIANLDGIPHLASSVSMVLNIFRADIYIINWMENVGYSKLGDIQFLLDRFALWAIKKRGKKIVWMFHNIHPHGGHNKYSLWLHDYFFKNASLIIAHSKEAAEYAKGHTEKKVLYVCHPIHPIKMKDHTDIVVESCDVLIWGSVVPYKGIYEFLQQVTERKTDLRIRILGECESKSLAKQIKGLCNSRITFENRRASFEEIAASIKKSHYTLFPYVGSCVSSSGALIDTIMMGGNPVGPNVGAFRDLADEDVCHIYKDYDELFSILEHQNLSIGDKARKEFYNNNSWDHLIDIIHDNL